MVPLAPAVGAPLLSGAVLCAVSLVASARPLALKLPNVSWPKLPDLDLPNFGKKADKPKAGQTTAAKRVPSAGSVKVRVARGAAPTGDAVNAPTLADIAGQVSQDTIAAGAGWKKFPERRMPGANMDGWKKIAKDMAPKF